MTVAAIPPGIFITIEGGEGGGKSTQAHALVNRLEAAGVPAIPTREPGGSDTAELIRYALLDGMFERLGHKAEALLFSAARIDHLDKRIKPALKAGTWVISDRFHDSTRAYQGAAGTLDSEFLESLERVTLAGLRPALTFVLDLPAKVGLSRAAARRGHEGRPDRFERQALRFHRNLRRAFLEIASRDPERCVVIDAVPPPAQVERAIWDALNRRLDLRALSQARRP